MHLRKTGFHGTNLIKFIIFEFLGCKEICKKIIILNYVKTTSSIFSSLLREMKNGDLSRKKSWAVFLVQKREGFGLVERESGI